MLSGQLSLVSRNGEGLFIKLVFFWGLSEAHTERLQGRKAMWGIIRRTPTGIGVESGGLPLRK